MQKTDHEEDKLQKKKEKQIKMCSTEEMNS